MWVDFHWHARDWAESHKETVKHSLELAYASGGLAIGTMPNPKPALTTLELCREYLKLAEAVSVPVQLYTHIALTADLEQVKRAVEATRKEPGICGMKMFFGHSTGNLGITRRDLQYYVLETLAREGYDGVLVGHLEKQNLLQDSSYDPKNPSTWSTHCRPEIAEIAAFSDALEILEELHFAGKFHAAHVSTLPVIDFIDTYTGPLKLSCGVTPHHLLLDASYLSRNDGAWYKCNPPLRSKETQQGLLQRLMQGKIPIVESDHAPHTEEDKYPPAEEGKEKPLPASGIASGLAWAELRAYLRGVGISEQQLKAVMFDHAVALYSLQEKIPYEKRGVLPELEKIRAQYPHQPFAEFFEGE